MPIAGVEVSPLCACTALRMTVAVWERGSRGNGLTPENRMFAF